MTWSPTDIAAAIDGQISGYTQVTVDHVSGLATANERSIGFLFRQSHNHYLENSKAAVIILSSDRSEEPRDHQCFIKVKNVISAMDQLSSFINQDFVSSNGESTVIDIASTAEVHDSVTIGAFSIIADGARVGQQTKIGSQVYIGPQVSIGKNCILYPGVKLYANTHIGDHVIIHSNAVIGSDGFGYEYTNDQFEKITHFGNVIIEDHVEIGSNTVIDRAAFDSTIIRKGTKLDNLIQVAHNVEIGEHTAIAAQTGISGSSRIGSHVQLGGQVGIAGHLEIADGSSVQAKSGVPSSITEKNKKWYGYPTLPYRAYLKSYALFKRLPELFNQMKELRKDIERLRESKK